MARVVEGIRIAPSPDWLRKRLEATGSRSINNVVDVTNYVLRTHGQPIHAFDAEKVEGQEIVVRRARPGERLTLLDGRDVALNPGVLVIAGRSRPMALAGIMGGLETGVTDATKRVILESAEFSPELTRDAARSLGIETDASQRFTQGVDPGGVAIALDETARLLAEVASGQVLNPVVDHWPGKEPPKKLRLRRERLVKLLGLEVPRAQITHRTDRLRAWIRRDDQHRARGRDPTGGAPSGWRGGSLGDPESEEPGAEASPDEPPPRSAPDRREKSSARRERRPSPGSGNRVPRVTPSARNRAHGGSACARGSHRSLARARCRGGSVSRAEGSGRILPPGFGN